MLIYRMGSTIQPGHVDRSALDLPSRIWKSSLFRALCSVDFPSFFRYHGRHDSLARYVLGLTKRREGELTISILPILQDRLLVHCPSSIKEERPSQPIRLRFRNPQTRLYPFHRSISRHNHWMAIQ
jgi:hypothetical protein